MLGVTRMLEMTTMLGVTRILGRRCAQRSLRREPLPKNAAEDLRDSPSAASLGDRQEAAKYEDIDDHVRGRCVRLMRGGG